MKKILSLVDPKRLKFCPLSPTPMALCWGGFRSRSRSLLQPLLFPWYDSPTV